jgi:hypothetical protein
MCQDARMTAPLRTDFDEFLLAPIGEDASGLPLTMLSALARLDVDPWEEAASLARLPVEAATQRLVSLLATVPDWRVPKGDAATIATLLVGLLHRSPAKKAGSPAAPPRAAVAARSKDARLAIYYLVALIFMLAAQWVTAIRNPNIPMNQGVVPVSPQ